MDIPLPDEPPVNENVEESLADIPVPEDTNRYSPSLPIEDDPPEFKNDISSISLPSDPQKLPAPPTVSVLGKEAAKKRLLAFSQTKQSLISQKRKSNQIFIDGNTSKENDSKSYQSKKKKKGVLDKARDTISEIEELKRRETEVMETMQVLFPMWSTLDKKTTPVTSLIIPDGVVERSDRIESVVEKLLSKKSKHERKEQERIERSEERKRKRQRREKEIRRLMPKSWTEFNKSGFKAYHFRRQKFKLEKLSEGMKSKDRNRSYEHERESSKRINLFDTPMILKKPLVVSGANNEDVEFPSWTVRYTNTWPSISYCLNPKFDTKRYISRKEMLSTVPDNIYAIIKKFLSPSSCNTFSEGKVESSRSWWERDSFLIPEAFNNFVEDKSDTNAVENLDDTKVNTSVPDLKFSELNDETKENENERFDKNSTKSISDSPVQSSEGLISDTEKSINSAVSETELVEDIKLSSPSCGDIVEDNNTNDENLASEYEQFIKTIGPNTDCKEVHETTALVDEIWSEVSKEEKELNVESPIATSENKKQENPNNKKLIDKKVLKEKKKKLKKKVIKKSQSSDSSSSESSSKSSSSGRSRSSSSSSSRSSSTNSTSSSSSSSSSGSSSSSSSSSDSTSSSNDSSSESSSSSSSTGTSSSDSHSLQDKPKKLKSKHFSKKKLLFNKKNKSKKPYKEENDDGKPYIKKNKKKKDSLVKIVEELEKSENEEEVIDITKSDNSPQEEFTTVQEDNSKGERNNPSIITAEVEKKSQAQIYEPRDYSPQSRTSEEDISDLSNSSLKSNTSEPVVGNEHKGTNNSLRWNSAEDSVSNLPMKQEASDNIERSSEGKRHFNLDIFQESHNYTSDVSISLESNIDENSLNISLSHKNYKEELKEENDNNNSSSLTNVGGEESALKSLERYSPTAEDEDEEEDEDFLASNASVGGSTLDEASQLVSFGVNSASEEARMLDIPLPPPIEALCEAPPTSFHNILQLPSSPTNNQGQVDVKKKNIVLVGKSPVARLTFGKQVIKLKPMNIFSAEDSDSEALPEKTPFPFAPSETNDVSLLSSNDALETKGDRFNQDLVSASENVKVSNEEVNSGVTDSNVKSTTVSDIKPLIIGYDSSSPLSKKSRWDQEVLKNAEKGYVDGIETSLLSSKPSNLKLEMFDISEKKKSDGRCDINSSEVSEKVKEKARKEHSRSPTFSDKKRRRERSHSSERDRRRRERVWSPRDRGRFSRDRRRIVGKRSRSKERRGRRDSPHHEYSPNWKKSSPQNKSLYRSPSDEGELKKSFDKIQRPENVSVHEPTNEPSTTFESWSKNDPNLGEVKESCNASPKKKESLSDWDSPERKYSPSTHKESPKRKKSPILRESPFCSPRNSPVKRKSPDHYRRKESPLRRRTPENRKESPNRRYSPRRSPMSWKRLSPDRRRSPYSPRRASPVRRRVTPDRKRPGSPYRRRLSPSPERKYSSRYSRKSPTKHRSYSSSPSRDEKWKWEEESTSEKKTIENDHFPKWDYETTQNNPANDYQTSLADSTISDSELIKEPSSPKRMSLDERLKIELGQSNASAEQERIQSIPAYHNFYYPPPTTPDRIGYYPHQQFSVSPQPPPGLPPDWNPSVHPPQLPNKLVQVGNVLQVVPTEIPVEPVFSAPPPKIIRNLEVLQPKVLQVGNMLQVVPSQEPPPPPPPPPPPQSVATLQFNTNSMTPPSPVAAPVSKLATSPSQPAQPVSIISLPFPPGSPNVFLKLEEKERRKKEKELRKQKKEQKAARRMLRKAMLKKRLAKANEADNEDNTSIVEIVRDEASELDNSKTSVVLPSPDKGILISLKDTVLSLTSKRKSVSFADGIKPGEGTSPSGGEEHPLSPPPLIRKPVKKRKKRKVKVRIIRIDSNTKEDESEEDDLSPPPPPPGTPPPEAYIEYTASGRYLYPVSTSQPFQGNQDVGTVFPSLPAVTANAASVVQFSTPPLPQQR